MVKQGRFVGLTILDLIYLSDHISEHISDHISVSHEKLVALDALRVAGGLAIHAAIAFRHLAPAADQ